MKMGWLTLALLPVASMLMADDRFNCPEPKGLITLDEDHWKAMPAHIDRILPFPLDVDFVCRINGKGRFEACSFAARGELTGTQATTLYSYMTRFVNHMKSDVPNQPCVASTIKLQMPPTEPV